MEPRALFISWWPYQDSNPSYGYDHVFAIAVGSSRKMGTIKTRGVIFG